MAIAAKKVIDDVIQHRPDARMIIVKDFDHKDYQINDLDAFFTLSLTETDRGVLLGGHKAPPPWPDH